MSVRMVWWVVLVWFVAAIGFAAEVAPEAAAEPTRAERVAIESCLAMMPPKVQVAIALVLGDEVRFLGAERTDKGMRFVENRAAVFQIGSISKVFTATLLAQQVKRGALRLDDAVAGHLPFKLKVSGREGVEMTLGQLGSHTSGIAHHQPPGMNRHAFLRFHLSEPLRDYDRARFEGYLTRDLALASTPGTRYLYSNIGMSLVGLVASIHAGKPYETLLQEEIFGPLGLSSSSTDLARVRDRVVPGLKVNGKSYPNQDFGMLAPAGGIYTSAEDLARFARVQIERLDPAIVLSQQVVFTISEGEYVALGWHLYDWQQGWRTLNHNGGIGGYTSTMNVDPDNRCASIVLSNVMNLGDHGEAVRALGRALLRLLESAAAKQH